MQHHLTSKFAKKANLASLKSYVDELDIDELKTVPFALNNLNSKVFKLNVNNCSCWLEKVKSCSWWRCC